jgi:glutamyl-tRNA reductase
MHYAVLSFTYKNTEIGVREKLAFNSDEKLLSFYNKLKDNTHINESLIISTCNRVVILLNIKEQVYIKDYLYVLLLEIFEIDYSELKNSGAYYEDVAAIHYIFSVAASLDSLVVGETQIVGQIKDAFKFSVENNFSGQKIARVMHHAFRCSAAVRKSTDISKNPVSISSVAVAKAKGIFGGNLGGYSAIIVGAGEMSMLCAKHLANAGANLIIVNRNIERAYELANHIDGVSVTVEHFDELPNLVNRYRLLFTATSAPNAVITKDMVKETSFQRHWFDIAVPRDIDCECENINVYAVDDLRDIMYQNIQVREENAKIGYEIVGQFTEEFFKWLQTLSIDPLIKEIRQMARECSQKEISKAIKKGYIDKEMENQVEKIIHQAFNSFLHAPTQVLKNVAENQESDTVVQSIQLFFGLNAKQRKALNMYKCDYYIEKDFKSKEKN